MTTLLILIALAIYFLPSIIAVGRDKKNATAIVVLNLIFGLSGIGYIIALIWSLCED